jgi:endonuclease-3 related protein
LIDFLDKNYKGDLKELFILPIQQLRKQLLSVNGIGFETADSIILYAAKKPIFVIDAYTRRILLRHKLIKPSYRYNDIQFLFMNNLSANVNLFNEYHALLVRLGKEFCLKNPRCRQGCPLNKI